MARSTERTDPLSKAAVNIEPEAQTQAPLQVLPCPKCNSTNTRVIAELEADSPKPLWYLRRFWQCNDCGRRWPLPYNWGKFQGWTMLIAGPLVAIYKLSWLAVIGVPLTIASGYAFAWRKKYAVWMPYAWMGFYAVIALLQYFAASIDKTLTPEQRGEEIGKGIGMLLIALVFWSVCAVYYHKRSAEFNWENESDGGNDAGFRRADSPAAMAAGNKELQFQSEGKKIATERVTHLRRYVAVLLVMMLGTGFLWFVWPTRYRYERVKGETYEVPVRIDRLTGKAEWLTSIGWKPMGGSESPDHQQEQELPSSELARLNGECSIDHINWLNCDIYNGSGWRVDDITIAATVRNKETGTEVLSGDYRLIRKPQPWNPIEAVKQKYPNMGLSDDQIFQKLSDPLKFRSAFPEYASLDDNTIRMNVARFRRAPHSLSPQYENGAPSEISSFHASLAFSVAFPPSLSWKIVGARGTLAR